MHPGDAGVGQGVQRPGAVAAWTEAQRTEGDAGLEDVGLCRPNRHNELGMSALGQPRPEHTYVGLEQYRARPN